MDTQKEIPKEEAPKDIGPDGKKITSPEAILPEIKHAPVGSSEAVSEEKKPESVPSKPSTLPEAPVAATNQEPSVVQQDTSSATETTGKPITGAFIKGKNPSPEEIEKLL